MRASRAVKKSIDASSASDPALLGRPRASRRVVIRHSRYRGTGLGSEETNRGRCAVRISWSTLWLALVLATSASAQDKPELAKVRLAVGGQAALYYLPLTLTQR